MRQVRYYFVNSIIFILKGVIPMDHVIETNDAPRKEWAAPELKKIDIEEITAGGPSGPNDDGYGGLS